MRLWFIFIGIFTVAALLPLAAHNESPAAEIEAERSAKPAPQTQAAPSSKTPGGFTVSGADAELAVNAAAGTSPSLLFQEDGTTMFSLQASSLTDTVSLRNATAVSLLTISQNGQVDQTYSGSDSFALRVTGNTSGNLAQFNNSGSGYSVYGSSSNAAGIGVYGANSSSNSLGYLGGQSFGVYGQNNNGRKGYLGGASYGVYGETANGFYGFFGTQGAGAGAGDPYGNGAFIGTGQYGVMAYATGIDEVDSAAVGQNVNYDYTGYLGRSDCGVCGRHYIQGGKYISGYLGSADYGVWGQHEGTGNYGYIGGTSYSMYANLAGSTPGNYAIYGYGVPNSGVAGTSYASHGTIGGVKGRSFYGNSYTFAVTGYSGLHYNRSGATFGAEPTGTTPWGCLAYRNSGSNLYGGYFTSYTSGSGLAAEDEPAAGIGLGAVGDLMGGWVRGGYYGLFVRGSRYGQYVQGDSYFSGCIAGIKQTESGKRVVTYAPASESPDVYAYGIGQLNNGAAQIEFSENFRGLVSDTEPLVVTVTAIGRGAQIALEAWDTTGFAVSSAPGVNGDGQFTWIAIGKQKGLETHRAPAELLAPEFEDNMAQVTHNDGDTATDGLGMFVDKGQLHYGTPSIKPRPQPQEQE